MRRFQISTLKARPLLRIRYGSISASQSASDELGQFWELQNLRAAPTLLPDLPPTALTKHVIEFLRYGLRQHFSV
jgi:hypothetical protein